MKARRIPESERIAPERRDGRDALLRYTWDRHWALGSPLPPGPNPLYDLWLTFYSEVEEAVRISNAWTASTRRITSPRLHGADLDTASTAFNEFIKSTLKESETRTAAVRYLAWGVPDPATLARLARMSPLLEVGAGRGYWARLLRDLGADIIATDAFAPMPSDHPTLFAAPEQCDAFDAVDRYGKGRTLLSVWPADSSHAMARYLAIGGRRIVLVGERDGCTGFFPDGVEPQETHPVARWDGYRDRLFVYEAPRARRSRT